VGHSRARALLKSEAKLVPSCFCCKLVVVSRRPVRRVLTEVWHWLACLLRSTMGMSHSSSIGMTETVKTRWFGCNTEDLYSGVHVSNLSRRCIYLLLAISGTMKFILNTTFSKSLPNNFLSQLYILLVHQSHSTSCIIHVFTWQLVSA
jgi:hypothetical protein